MNARSAATFRRSVLGVPIDAMDMPQAVARVEAAIAARERLLIGVVNAAKIVNMRRDAALRDAVLSSDVIFADGMSVVWASRVLGESLPERVAGIDLMHAMLTRGAACGWRFYCLGARQEILTRFLDNVKAAHPGVQIAGAHHGYYTAAEEPGIAAQIAAARPDILLVAMTSPRKEQFLARWQGVLGPVVSHGVGGSFDVVAGLVRRAPQMWQKLGLEWLYRVLQEPGRLWKRYLVTNTIFIGLVARAMISRIFGRSRAEPASESARLVAARKD